MAWIFDNIRFPYPNMQELNLDWIMTTIKNMANDMEQMKKIIEEADIDEIVKNALLEMIDNGELAKLVSKFIPTADEVKEYQNGTLSVIASWLVNLINTHSIVDPNNVTGQTIPFYARYNDTGKTYSDLIENYGTDDFTYSDTYNGEPVIYMMCSGMLQTVLRGREFTNSANYEALQTPYNLDNVMSKCWEAGSTNDKNWTIDCMNNMSTWKMANVLNNSGCTLQLLHAVNDADYADILKDMQTGDVIFFGNTSFYPSRFRGIFHCAYYIKDIADLNVFGVQYNAEFKPVTFSDHNDTSNGIIFHCAGGVGDNYTDVIRLETLDHYFYNHLNADFWVCRPYSNALNSTKAQRMASGIFRGGDKIYMVSPTGSANYNPAPFAFLDLTTGKFNIGDPALNGREKTVTDLNNLNPGLSFITDLSGVANCPTTTDTEAMFFNIGNLNGRMWQFGFFPNEHRIRYRRRDNTNTWDSWKNISYTVV